MIGVVRSRVIAVIKVVYGIGMDCESVEKIVQRQKSQDSQTAENQSCSGLVASVRKQCGGGENICCHAEQADQDICVEGSVYPCRDAEGITLNQCQDDKCNGGDQVEIVFFRFCHLFLLSSPAAVSSERAEFFR